MFLTKKLHITPTEAKIKAQLSYIKIQNKIIALNVKKQI